MSGSTRICAPPPAPPPPPAPRSVGPFQYRNKDAFQQDDEEQDTVYGSFDDSLQEYLVEDADDDAFVQDKQADDE